ncbi:aminotransferase class I/II-fold pyridoxal phosphate-dependent enzyme [Candidatus Woesearchaeota archaeon]|nr:aminotransferase class I/II-fold pyridoxal phosphate-dependent enzyme [Candidatus Woesearchaeota archaeon]
MQTPFERPLRPDPIRSRRQRLLSAAREAGVTPLDLSQGNPCGSINGEYAQRLQDLIIREREGVSESNAYTSSSGHSDFRSSVADLERRVNGLATTEEHIVAMPGAAQGIVALLDQLSPGEVLIISPYFPLYVKYATHTRLTPNIIPYTNNEETLLQQITTNVHQNTRALILNSPNNPSGKIFSVNFLRNLGDMLHGSNNDKRNLLVISDEPYRALVREGEQWNSVIKTLDYELTAVVYSFSKEGRLAGCRIGYVALHPEFPDYQGAVQRLADRLPARGVVQAPTREQLALSQCHLPLNVDWQPALQKLRTYEQELSRLGFTVLTPQGGLYLCARHPVYDGDRLSENLLQVGIGVVPGRPFGIPQYVRLALCTPDSDKVDEVIGRFQKVI